MGALTGFKLLHPGMGALLKGAGARAAVEPAVAATLAKAQADAPVDTGAYRDSLHIEWVVTDRIVGRVVAGTDHAMLVEAHTGNLARALDAAG